MIPLRLKIILTILLVLLEMFAVLITYDVLRRDVKHISMVYMCTQNLIYMLGTLNGLQWDLWRPEILLRVNEC